MMFQNGVSGVYLLKNHAPIWCINAPISNGTGREEPPLVPCVSIYHNRQENCSALDSQRLARYNRGTLSRYKEKRIMSMTVKQLADSLGVTKTAIRKRFTEDFRANHVQTTANGVIIISDEGCKLIAETLQTTANQIPQTAETDTANPENSLLETTIAVLREQLSEKDKQITALTSALTTSQEQVKQLTESLHDTTAALTAAQALHAGTIQQQLIDKQVVSEDVPESVSEPEQRKGFFKRFFKRG